MSHPGTGTLIDTLFHKGKSVETSNQSLTPESASIQPEPQDFEAVDREFGPIPLDATAKEAVHRYRLAQATKILRLNQQEQIERRAHLDLGIIMSGSRWSYNSSERNQIHGIITNLRDAVRVDGVRATNHWRESLSSYAGFGDPTRNSVTELFNLSGLWVRNRGNRAELKPKILQLVERLVSVLTDHGFHRLAP